MSKLSLLCVLAAAVLTGAATKVENYQQCLIIAGANPAHAYDIAAEWRDYGGGARAEHCMAVALVGEGKYKDAAELLDKVAQSLAEDPLSKGRTPKAISAGRAGLLSQAGNAWLMAKEPDKAYIRFSDALEEPGVPDDLHTQLLVDRARASADLNHQEAAVKDLSEALERGGPQSDVLTYRGAAYRALGSLAKARADIKAALDIDPQNYEALFERGYLDLEVGNEEGAIVDWLAVKHLAPDSLAAKDAEANIQKVRAAQEKAKAGAQTGAAQSATNAPGQPASTESTGQAPAAGAPPATQTDAAQSGTGTPSPSTPSEPPGQTPAANAPPAAPPADSPAPAP